MELQGAGGILNQPVESREAKDDAFTRLPCFQTGRDGKRYSYEED